MPEPTEPEIGFLLDVVSAAFAGRCTAPTSSARTPGCGRCSTTPRDGATADLSRRHAVLTCRTGVVTIVGGKLTTYRRMAEDAVDAAVARAGLDAGPCRTRTLPLLGAAPRAELAGLEQPARLVRRFGTDAELVLDNAREVTGLADDELLAPVADGVPVTLAELVFGVTHEGAADVDDLLDRRTRVGLVPADRARAVPAAERALSSVLDPSPTARPRQRIRGDSRATDEFCPRRRSTPEADWTSEERTMTTATGTGTMTTTHGQTASSTTSRP